jgi:hypothetical protein
MIEGNEYNYYWLVTCKKKVAGFSDQEKGNDYGPLRPHHHNIQWAISV